MKWKKRNRFSYNTTYQGYHFSLIYSYSGEYYLDWYELTTLESQESLKLGYLDTLTDAKKQAEKIIYNLTERKVKPMTKITVNDLMQIKGAK